MLAGCPAALLYYCRCSARLCPSSATTPRLRLRLPTIHLATVPACFPPPLQVDHELSVPAVTMILMSCVALTVSVASDLLMGGGLTRLARAALLAAGPLGTGAGRRRGRGDAMRRAEH